MAGDEFKPEARTIEEIRARHAACEPGPWFWWGNMKYRHLRLATVGRGRQIIMDFVRWGMTGAQPRFREVFRDGCAVMTPVAKLVEVDHNTDILSVSSPEARAIERSWEDVEVLLRRVDELEEALRRAEGREAAPAAGN